MINHMVNVYEIKLDALFLLHSGRTKHAGTRVNGSVEGTLGGGPLRKVYFGSVNLIVLWTLLAKSVTHWMLRQPHEAFTNNLWSHWNTTINGHLQYLNCLVTIVFLPCSTAPTWRSRSNWARVNSICLIVVLSLVAMETAAVLLQQPCVHAPAFTGHSAWNSCAISRCYALCLLCTSRPAGGFPTHA